MDIACLQKITDRLSDLSLEVVIDNKCRCVLLVGLSGALDVWDNDITAPWSLQ